MILPLLSLASFSLMAAVDIAYGHSIYGKLTALFLFLIGVSLALASLADKP